MPLTLGPNHMSNIRHYEVQRLNNFEVVFDGLNEDITLAISSIGLPGISNDPITLSYGNSNVKVAGQGQFADVSFTVKDFILANIEGQLWAWRKQVYDPATHRVGWAEDYKKNGRIYQYGPDGTYLRAWRCLGCWPTNFTAGDYSNDGSGAREITMNMSVDLAYPEDGFVST